MAVTKSWETDVAVKAELAENTRAIERNREFRWLLAATAVVSLALAFVYAAKTRNVAEEKDRLARGSLLDLNGPVTGDQLKPVLEIALPGEQVQKAADRVLNFLDSHKPLPNVGALARLHPENSPTKPLFAIARIKPLLTVRTPAEFTREYVKWASLYLLAFWAVHLLWRWRRFRGDPLILPALVLLTGFGLTLMVSLRDPLRDTLEFKKFAEGVVIGCAVLLSPLIRFFRHRNFARSVYTPLLAALGLFAALLALGSGPTGSDAKVNLGPFQPVELVKILVVFFLAGYFATNWERLRDLRQKLFIPRWLRWLEIPRVAHSLPVMFAVACALLMFFLLKDMGPALVTGFLFLLLFAVARGKSGLALLGVVLLVGGVTIGYRMGAPHTVVDRVSMWLSPWDNNVRGGDQLAHSLWAFATGGPWGSGPGLGDPSVIPAGHTDLVLPSIAEEWGFPGVLCIFLLLGLIVQRAFRIAVRAPDEYGTFLAAGFGVLLALEMLLISGGALGAIPLSGVVSPFLSSGNTAMLCNFLICAILLGISNQSVVDQAFASNETSPEKAGRIFRIPLRVVGAALGVCAVALLARAISIEAVHDDELIARTTLVYTQDGVKRPQRNPRLNLLAASIPRGDIYDRNGILLSTSNWDHLEQQRAQYRTLGVNIDQACSRVEQRHYPFGPVTGHFLGDLRTGEKFHATNASLVEHDSNARLQGYSDIRDLAPLVRYRHQPGNPRLQALFRRDRDVHTTIDIRLQLQTASILAEKLGPAGKKGSAVILNPASGDVLAMVNWPQPPASGSATPDELLDRARYGEYPPGSTFKLVTAIAALRLDPQATKQTFTCRGLGDGRVGVEIPGWRRPVRDDIGDHAHGTLDMKRAIAVSCNAYFAQLGVHNVGAQALHDTAQILGISTGDLKDVRKMLPFASYGQAEVVATPFKMARVAATISNGGAMPVGRWVTDESNTRNQAASPVLEPASAQFLSDAMRDVVTAGTARSAMAGIAIPVAGKTGTAQLDAGEPHSWFAGFAPFGDPSAKQIAFAVIVEHGGYGAQVAAPIGRALVESAQKLGIIMVAAPADK